MKKRKRWRKEWHDRRCQKIGLRKKAKRTFHVGSESCDPVQKKAYHGPTEKWYTAPEEFSLIHNANGTIEYFNEIYDDIKKKRLRAKFHINSSAVKHVTVDALIYLIAVMENMKLNRILQYEFSGTLPRGYSARMVYLDSGFMSYVQSKMKRLPKNTSKVQIISDNQLKASLSKRICEFAMEKFELKRKDTIFIQKILVELMSNSYYHAYPEDVVEEMASRWYLYAEYIDGVMRIIFADTGKGITGTVRRRFRERVGGITDEELLLTAMQPDNFIRTETKKDYRGNGLPGIKDIVEKSPITSFWVFSGKGAINIQGKSLTKHSFEHKIHGTIFIFEFGKGSFAC